MCKIRKIFIVLSFSIILIGKAFAEGPSEVVGTVAEDKSTWYAITKINGNQKLITKGDIFCSEVDITDCFRVEDIKKDSLIIKHVGSKKTFTLRPGERIPLEGVNIIFERTVNAKTLEYRYKESRDTNGTIDDFSIKDIKGRKVVLERFYNGEEREFFSLPEDAKIEAAFFKDMKIERIEDNEWVVDKDSSRAAIRNAGKALVEVIKRVRPQYRFRQGFILRFNCELGRALLNREGFLVENLAVARLAEKTGIKKGDLIKSINGQAVNSLYGIYKAYMAVKASNIKVVNVDIMRDGKPQRLVYKLE